MEGIKEKRLYDSCLMRIEDSRGLETKKMPVSGKRLTFVLYFGKNKLEKGIG